MFKCCTTERETRTVFSGWIHTCSSEIGDEGGRVVGAALQVRHDVAPHAVDYPPIKLSDALPPIKLSVGFDQERDHKTRCCLFATHLL